MKHSEEYRRRGLDTGDVAELIDRWIFKERDRAVMKRKLLDGLTFEETAEEFGMSVRGIKYIVYRGESIIFSHI